MPVEVRRDVAEAGVLSEYGWRQIPGAVLETGQRRPLVAAAQWRALQHGPAIKRMRACRRNELQGCGPLHVRASSGR